MSNDRSLKYAAHEAISSEPSCSKDDFEPGAPKGNATRSKSEHDFSAGDALRCAGPFIGIDYGLARTGLALSDPQGCLAFPLATVKMTTRKEYFDSLTRLIEREQPCGLVVGLPLREDGSDSLTTRQARNFADSLQRRVALPIFLVSEYLSSHEAECQMREAGAKAGTIRAKLDQQAAVRILQSFLDERHAGRRF